MISHIFHHRTFMVRKNYNRRNYTTQTVHVIFYLCYSFPFFQRPTVSIFVISGWITLSDDDINYQVSITSLHTRDSAREVVWSTRSLRRRCGERLVCRTDVRSPMKYYDLWRLLWSSSTTGKKKMKNHRTTELERTVKSKINQKQNSLPLICNNLQLQMRIKSKYPSCRL